MIHFSLFVQFNLSLIMRISHKGIFWNLKVLHDYISGMYSIIVISTIIFQNKFLYKQQMFKRVYVPLLFVIRSYLQKDDNVSQYTCKNALCVALNTNLKL